MRQEKGMRKIDEKLIAWMMKGGQGMAEDDRLESLRKLMRAGADPLVKDGKGGVSVAQDVMARGDLEALRVMAREGLNPSARIDGTPLIIKALQMSRMECAEELIKAGADASAKDEGSGLDALMVAVRWNKREWAQKLMALGADPRTSNESGASAMMTAFMHGEIGLALDLQEASQEGLLGGHGFDAVKWVLASGNVTPTEWERLEKIREREPINEASVDRKIQRISAGLTSKTVSPALEWELARLERTEGKGLRDFVESAAIHQAMKSDGYKNEAKRRWQALKAGWEASLLGKEAERAQAGKKEEKEADEEGWEWSLDSIRKQKQRAIETIQEQQRRLGDMEAIESWLRVSEALGKWPGIERVRVRGIKNSMGATSWMVDVEKKEQGEAKIWSMPIKMDPIARSESGDGSANRSVEEIWGEEGKQAWVEFGRAWVSAMNRAGWTEVWLPAKDKEELRRKMLTPEQMARSEKEEMEESKPQARSAARL